MVKKSKLEQKVKKAIAEQLEALRQKFGRETLPGEPVFFAPDSDTSAPIQIDEGKLTRDTLKMLRAAGAPPEAIYAYKRTGLLLTEEFADNYEPEAILEWNAAIDEYFEREATHQEGPQNPDRMFEYAFAGETIGEIVIKLCGKEVKRTLKVSWEHTPPWKHFDEAYQKEGLIEGRLAAYSLKTAIWIDPTDSPFDKDPNDEDSQPYWEDIELYEDGIFGKEMELALEDDIDCQCKDLNNKRRP